jgi:hypothetical protein
MIAQLGSIRASLITKHDIANNYIIAATLLSWLTMLSQSLTLSSHHHIMSTAKSSTTCPNGGFDSGFTHICIELFGWPLN